MKYIKLFIITITAFVFSSLTLADSNEPGTSFFDEIKDVTEIHGFYEMRRLQAAK